MQAGWARQLPARWVSIAFLGIILVDCAVFAPSWSHTVRGDHISYLADTARDSSWWDLVSNHYSYDRSRQFNRVATEYFRPVQFLLLGTERWLFGCRFALWQLVGFVLHLVIVWRLLKLLLRIRPTVVAPLLALFFSVMYFPLEQVIWHHLHGYLLLALLLVVTLEQILTHEQEGQASRWRLAAIGGLLLVGCFTHEVMIGMVPLFALYLAWVHPARTRQRALPLLLMATALLYAIASIADYKLRGCVSTPDLEGAFTPTGTAANLTYSLFAWISGGLCPFFLHGITQERFQMWPAARLMSSPWLFYSVPTALVVSVVGGLASIARRRWSETKPNARFAMLVFAVLLAWCGLYTVVRFNTMGVDLGMAFGAYYSYPVWLLLLVGAHTLIDPLALGRAGRTVLAVGFVLSLASNGWLSWRANVDYRTWGAPRAALVAHVERMIRDGATPAEFRTFQWRHDVVGNQPMPQIQYDPDPDLFYTLPEALWPERFPCGRRGRPK